MKKLLARTIILTVGLACMPGNLYAGAATELTERAAKFLAEHLMDHGALYLSDRLEKFIQCRQEPSSCKGLDPAAVGQFQSFSPSDVAALRRAVFTPSVEEAPPIAPDRVLIGR